MRIAYVVFGLTFAGYGIVWITRGETGTGVVYLAIGVGWLLVVAFKGRQSASHRKSERGAA